MRFSVRHSKMLLVFCALIVCGIPFATFAGEGGPPNPSLQGPPIKATLVITNTSGSGGTTSLIGSIQCQSYKGFVNVPETGIPYGTLVANQGQNFEGFKLGAGFTDGCPTVGESIIVNISKFSETNPGEEFTVSIRALYLQ